MRRAPLPHSSSSRWVLGWDLTAVRGPERRPLSPWPGMESWTCPLAAEGRCINCALSEVASVGLLGPAQQAPPSSCTGAGSSAGPSCLGPAGGDLSASPVLAQTSWKSESPCCFFPTPVWWIQSIGITVCLCLLSLVAVSFGGAKVLPAKLSVTAKSLRSQADSPASRALPPRGGGRPGWKS